MDSLEERVNEAIGLINNGHPAQAESCINSIRSAHQLDSLVLAMLSIVDANNRQPSSSPYTVNTIQTALLILKTIVTPDYDMLQPPTQQHLHYTLLDLLNHDKTKVRNVAALLVARVEWLNTLLQVLASPKSEHQLDGALSAIKEMLVKPLDQRTFLQIGPSILAALYQVATQSSIQHVACGPQAHLCATAIQVFRECIEYLLIEEETQSSYVATLVEPTVDLWCPFFLNVVDRHVDSTDLAAIDLTIESLKSYKALLTALPRLATDYAYEMFEVALQTTAHYLPIFEQQTIYNTAPEPNNIPTDILCRTGLSISNLVLEQIDYLAMATELETVVASVTTNLQSMPTFLDMAIRLAQIPLDSEDDTIEPATEIEESGYFFENGPKIARTQISEILQGLTLQPSSLVILLWERLGANQSTWKLQESGLYLVEKLLETGDSFDHTLEEALNKVRDGQTSSSHPLLESRYISTASTIVKSASPCVDLQTQFSLFHHALAVVSTHTHESVRMASILAIQKYCTVLPTDYIASQTQAIYKAVCHLANQAQDASTAAVHLVQTLIVLAQSNLAGAASNKDFFALLYSLAARDPTNAMLTNQIVDTVSSMGQAISVADHVHTTMYTDFAQCALVPVSAAIQNAAQSQSGTVGWDLELTLALGILDAIVQNAPPSGLPHCIVSEFLAPLAQIAQTTSDAEILAHATQILVLLCATAPQQLGDANRLDLVITTVKRLAASDEALHFISQLVSALVSSFSSPALLNQLVNLAVKLFATAHQPQINSSISIIKPLATYSTDGLVELLSQQFKNDSNVWPIFEKWIHDFDIWASPAYIQEK